MEKQHKPGKDREQHVSCRDYDKSRSPLAIVSRIACGLVFIAAATLVLLNIFGVISLTVNIGILVAITALAIVAICSAFHAFWGGLFFLAATIVVIMNANGLVFDLSGVAIGNLYIAATLLTIAFHLIFRRKFFSHSSHTDATFGSAVKYFNDELDTATLECNFGAVKAYFENATPKNGSATVNLDCNFGGIELYIPKSWKVLDKTRSTCSGTEEKNHPTITDSSPTLTLTGELNFCGITITYV